MTRRDHALALLESVLAHKAHLPVWSALTDLETLLESEVGEQPETPAKKNDPTVEFLADHVFDMAVTLARVQAQTLFPRCTRCGEEMLFGQFAARCPKCRLEGHRL